jgi:hypothetical protein
MADEEHLGAVFGERAEAEAAVEDLRHLGLADEHLGVAVRQPDGYVFEEDAETDVAHGIEKGIAIGAPVGAVAGMTVLALILPGVGTLGVGGILAAGGLSGALAGTYLGAFLGLAAEEPVLEEEWDWERVPLQPGQVLIVVAGHGHPDQVADVLERHGGHLVAKPPHVS